MQTFGSVHTQHDLCLDLFFSPSQQQEVNLFLKNEKEKKNLQQNLSWLLWFTGFSVFAVCRGRWNVYPLSRRIISPHSINTAK